jgi:hypothetical protein
MDCFVEPVIGPRFARTRWLAMTARAASIMNATKPTTSSRSAGESAALTRLVPVRIGFSEIRVRSRKILWRETE